MRYRTIVADPPWAYPEGFASAPESPHRQDRAKGASTGVPVVVSPLPYPGLSLAEIAELPIRDLADDDCRLFLWATMRYLPDAMNLIPLWGFKYRQTIVWDKTPNIPVFGGSVAPNTSEFLLVATRGAPARMSRWTTSVIRARKARPTHSRKPEVFMDLAESVSPGPYLEMFSRRARLGWDTWGDEALGGLDLTKPSHGDAPVAHWTDGISEIQHG